MTPGQAALLAAPRWAWLPDVLERWYATPLRAADSATPPEGLPGVLAEWFTLVGSRLREVQDSPATPGRLARDGELVEVWTENQGCWSLLAGPGEDPVCELDDGGYFPAFAPAPLSAVLRGMLMSDTLVAAWSGEPGALGPLAPGVRGGVVQGPAEAALAAVVAAYPALPLWPNPMWREAPRGDAGTVLRGSEGSWLEWMTADEESHARLAAVVDLTGTEEEA
ncbi:hypothetical protein Afil01_20590 [Actinorhabdospora filicis]|uniref:Uncharacterized protein n=1 Tax=Actinorhabdospora filicis TaxID=1785913 RepID=A0A9W6SK24_9ACTN|nr:hypothetical protein [Actinorhabdospora filicis]GLZ77252.1 hypothetical protein Afil01_20590 [Actinorhabdospora filicis]